ncbi:hypothetical protein A6M27_09740 [Acidithiobacillus thiooxidans]|uniref:Uncharacterized protein n=1 Tax=Acidithiobacillus thiooxidans TaxID=930 RepID=A0A1C2IHB1_ACITH|nr:hypothetical protein [Acidithiobacillus thiooxidans]OCX74085.1 hypothetical protein A6P07_06640 [Acidithiobacillus thiooxidans]OCX75361.1 hypothetical protein A6O24_09885 [Acidithiobacillus thiooxidans]OCX81849.1 hypothetical protein A6O26_11745 [Acidithiobacillus thiooxidans]OCX87982.1 hypothetical protein A6M27_09740 [Acidithiobacillus thiooxidans]OFC45258.1 hypothetical protein BAE47_10740 [Acidithiobacillus thiooxidans]
MKNLIITALFILFSSQMAYASHQRGRELAHEFCVPYVTVESQLFRDKDDGLTEKQAYHQVETEISATQSLSRGAVYFEAYRVYHAKYTIPVDKLSLDVIQRALMVACEAQDPFAIRSHNH